MKFAATIVEAIGIEPERPAAFDGLEDLPRHVIDLPNDAEALKALIASRTPPLNRGDGSLRFTGDGLAANRGDGSGSVHDGGSNVGRFRFSRSGSTLIRRLVHRLDADLRSYPQVGLGARRRRTPR